MTLKYRREIDKNSKKEDKKALLQYRFHKKKSRVQIINFNGIVISL